MLIWLNNALWSPNMSRYFVFTCPNGTPTNIAPNMRPTTVQGAQLQSLGNMWTLEYAYKKLSPWQDRWNRRKQFCHRFAADTSHAAPWQISIDEVFGKFEDDYRSLSDVFYSGGVQADTPVHNWFCNYHILFLHVIINQSIRLLFYFIHYLIYWLSCSIIVLIPRFFKT